MPVIRELLARLPDLRLLVATALFALTFYIFWLIAKQPGLTANQGFMLLAQAIVISGVIVVVNYLFGSSKGAADANARADKALEKIQPTDKGGQP